MPQVSLRGRRVLGCSWPGRISAFPSLPEMLMWAGSRAGMRHRAACQYLLPPVCTHAGPSLHPPAAFLSPGGLNKQGVKTGCRGLCPLVLGNHLFPCLIQCGGQRGWVTLPYQRATPQERSWSFVFLWVKRASSSLITFNWVGRGIGAPVMQRWCLPKGVWNCFPFIESYLLCIWSVWLSVMFQVCNFKLLWFMWSLTNGAHNEKF